MQAHPQSIPAALIPSQSPLLSATTAPLPPTLLLGQLDPVARQSVPADPRPANGIAHTTGLAHDAGNLLGALGLYCDLLRMPGVLQPEHLHYATELDLISSRSSDLIRRLLALSPADALPSSLIPTPITQAASQPIPSDLLRGAPQPWESHRPGHTHASVLRSLAPVLQRIAAGVATVSVSAPAVLPPLDLPMEALERIAVNLVRNAVEAIRKQQDGRPSGTSRTHGEIRVTLAILSGRLQLTVEDNGPGIRPAVAAAFLHPSPLPPNATHGLGHRIVHDLVSSTGGLLSIRSRPGNGTAFRLRWPLPLASAAQEGIASC